MIENSYIDLLKNRNFLPFMVSQITTNIGDGLFSVLLVYVALENGASPTELGFVIFCTVLPRGLFGPVGGVFGDRMDKKRLLLIVEIVRLLVILMVPLFILYDSFNIWVLAIAGFIIASMFSIGMPTSRAHIPRLVASENTQLANGLVQAVMWPFFFIGTGILTLILTVTGVKGACLVVAACFFVSLIMLLFIPSSTKIQNPVSVTPSVFISDIKTGYIELRTNELLFRRVIVYSMFTFFWRGLLGIALPLVLVKELGGEASMLGVLMLVAGCGELSSSLYVGKMRLKHPLLLAFCGEIALGISALVLFICMLVPFSFAVIFLAAFAIGVSPSLVEIPILTVIQRDTSSEHIGKVISYWALVGSAGGALGTLLFGSAIDLFSINSIVLLSAAILIIVGILSVKMVRNSAYISEPA